MLFRPAESSKEIVDFYKRYLVSTFKTDNSSLNEQLEKAINEPGSVEKGPYVSMSDSFEKDKSISELVEEGVLCRSMLKLKALHPERSLYKHQVDAIRKAVNNENIVVTTGTGSGKTECFLIPMINSLLQEEEQNKLSPGIRAMIIYPMNALVNDQIDRLREIFKEYNGSITFGKYTGETEEKYDKAHDKYIGVEKREPLRCELISRGQMRENAPNILITNYSMLEYLMLRPRDNVFFDPKGSEHWKYIILDEAHTYSGASGIELCNLLKRVIAASQAKNMQYILTSATLGDPSDDPLITGFAEKLCNATFKKNSVIRSATVSPEKPETIYDYDFSIYRKTAEMIKNNMAPEHIIDFLKKSKVEIIPGNEANDSLELTLYNLLIHDSFYYRLRQEMMNNTKTLSSVSKALGVSEDDLSDYITVSSNAKKGSDKLFESRYHMFLKSVDGVFITLNPDNHLFIDKRTDYVNDDGEEYKVYEISFCSNCNATYIKGNIDHGLGVLKQDYSSSDIFEDDEETSDVFMLDGNIDDDDDNSFERYTLCSRCGRIVKGTGLKNKICEHDNMYYVTVAKVSKKDDSEKINRCPKCHSVNNNKGILRQYLVGNNAVSAVIGTALYNVLPDTKITKTVERIADDFFGTGDTEQITEETQVKQFLTFSDNRQNAAFFASYFQNTYNENLIKRIMKQIRDDNESLLSEGIAVSDFVNLLKNYLKSNKIYSGFEAEKQAWIAVIKEIINPKAKNSMQNEGYLFFDADIDMPEASTLGLDKEQTTTLFKLLASFFMMDNALDSKAPLSDLDYASFSYGYLPNEYAKQSSGSKHIKSWLPNKETDNIRAEMIKKLFPDKEDKFAKDLLEAIWMKLIDKKIIVSKKDSGNYRIDLGMVKVKTADRLYICEKCKTITPYSMKNKCMCWHCDGTLRAYNPVEEKKGDHYRYLYNHLNISPLTVKEHTAQLSSEKAAEYQKRFKDEDINVLSCSTTFEMGVDLGTLETVFMRNVPPTPANYAQRAGRAGRSQKSAAYAITYCPSNPHSAYYFNNPEKMIMGTVTPPSIDVDNEKIASRHLFASALSFFWKKYPDMYTDSIGLFYEKNGVDAFRKYIESEPQDLKEYFSETLTDYLKEYFDIENFKWKKMLFGNYHYKEEDEAEQLISGKEECNFEFEQGVFYIAVLKYSEEILTLTDAQGRLQDRLNKTDPADAGYKKISVEIQSIAKRIKTIRDQRLIDYLSKNGLIPKYGFPVDLVELTSSSRYSGIMDSLCLTRDLSQAITEYAPGAEVIADGKVFTSQYLKKIENHDWPEYVIRKCDDCGAMSIMPSMGMIKKFPSCGAEIKSQKKSKEKRMLIPRFGMATKNTEPVDAGADQPKRRYFSNVYYIGKDQSKEYLDVINVCGHPLRLDTSRTGSLLALNSSSFYICPECGYGKPGDNDKPYITHKHKNVKNEDCSNNVLKRYLIGHKFQTDVVRLLLDDITIKDQGEAWSVMYALLEGLSKYLNIDRKEIGGCLNRVKVGNCTSFDFVFYDKTPGGAGYVQNLKRNDVIAGMLSEAYRIVSGCKCGGGKGDTACYNCLCNYYNQTHHDILKRSLAKNFLNKLRGEWKVFVVTSMNGFISGMEDLENE